MPTEAPGQTLNVPALWRGLLFQVGLVFLAWVYLVSLHWDNDGLWFQGDAPRHVANGIFWKDYLSSLSFDPKGYALSYYARYPVINPIAYPPVFYLLEAPLFALVGPSPYAAKLLVLVFSLVGALYLTVWLRRWVAEEAGWLGSLLLLLPLVIEVSHCVLLNAPALTMAIAALYHARSWMEAPTGRNAFVLFLLGGLAVLTYYQNVMLPFVIVAWLVSQRRVYLLWSRPVLVLGGLSALVLFPAAVLALVWEPTRVAWILNTGEGTWELSNWLYYAERLPRLINGHLLAVAMVGVFCGLFSKRWRNESVALLILGAVCYAFFSIVLAKDHRYILPISIPIVCFCAIALIAISQWVGDVLKLGPNGRRAIASAVIAATLISQSVMAARVFVPNVDSIERVATFAEESATDGMIFYDGPHRDLFACFVMIGDPEYQRRVVTGPKLVPRKEAQALTVKEARSVLLNRSHCRWLFVEDSPLANRMKLSRTLQKAVDDERFELIKTFPISYGRGEIRAYRARVAPRPPASEKVELIFRGGTYQVKPITR